MSKRNFFIDLLVMITGTLAGNWLGGQLRSLLTGKPVQSIQFEHTTESGLNIKNFPVATKFYPGFVFSFLGRPRGLFALLGGTLAGLLVDDRYEVIWLERVLVPLIVNRIPGKPAPKVIELDVEA